MDEFLHQLKMALESSTNCVVDDSEANNGKLGVDWDGRHFDIDVTETE